MAERGLRVNSARFREALTYAARLHAAQPRKGTDIPYVAHPRVADRSVRLVSAACKSTLESVTVAHT